MNDWLLLFMSLTSMSIVYWVLFGENKYKEMFK